MIHCLPVTGWAGALAGPFFTPLLPNAWALLGGWRGLTPFLRGSRKPRSLEEMGEAEET